MELIKRIVSVPPPPGHVSPRNTNHEIDYSLLLRHGPLAKSALAARPSFDVKESSRFINSETDSGIGSLASPTPDLDGNDLEEELVGLDEPAQTAVDSFRPKSLFPQTSPLEKLLKLKENLVGGQRGYSSSTPPNIFDLTDEKEDRFFQTNFERRYFPVLRDLLGVTDTELHEEAVLRPSFTPAYDAERRQRVTSLTSPSSDYEESDTEDKPFSVFVRKMDLDRHPAKASGEEEEEEEVDEGVQDMAPYSSFLEAFLRETPDDDRLEKVGDDESTVERRDLESLVEDIVVCASIQPLTMLSPNRRKSDDASASVASPRIVASQSSSSSSSPPRIEASQSSSSSSSPPGSCFLFEINVDALPRSPRENKVDGDRRHTRDSLDERRSSLASSSTNRCGIEISFDSTASTSSLSSTSSASPSALVSSRDLHKLAEIDIGLIGSLSFNEEEVEERGDFDEEDEEEEEEVDDDEVECLFPDHVEIWEDDGDDGDEEEDDSDDEQGFFSFSILDIVNGTGRHRRISEQSFDSVDWSESDNDESQVTFDDDDCSSQSFQPQVVIVAKVKALPSPQETDRYAEEKLMAETAVEKEKKRSTRKCDEEEERVVANKRHVTFAPDDQLARVCVMDDADEPSRKGPWEDHYRDSCRFRRRIFEADVRFNHIFSSSHREAIFRALHTTGECACHPGDGESEESEYEDC